MTDDAETGPHYFADTGFTMAAAVPQIVFHRGTRTDPDANVLATYHPDGRRYGDTCRDWGRSPQSDRVLLRVLLSRAVGRLEHAGLPWEFLPQTDMERSLAEYIRTPEYLAAAATTVLGKHAADARAA